MNTQMTIPLTGGVEMPMAGIGTFLLSPDEAEASCLSALKCGCRLIDTANAYVNERAVGRAMKRSGLDRKEIFLETKLWPAFYEQADAVEKTLAAESMVMQAWYPLGHGDKALLAEPVFAKLGQKYGKSAAQIILRWHVQSGTIVIPGSKNPAHIKDNFALFDFALTEEEMSEIAALDKGVRYYTSTPELLKKYAEMVPPVDQQK